LLEDPHENPALFLLCELLVHDKVVGSIRLDERLPVRFAVVFLGHVFVPFTDSKAVSHDVFEEDVNFVARSSHGLLVPDAVLLSAPLSRECFRSGHGDVLDGVNHGVGVIDLLLEMVEVAIVGNNNIVWDSESVATRVVVGEHFLEHLISVNIDEANVVTEGSSSADNFSEHDRVGLIVVIVVRLGVVSHHQQPRLGVSVLGVHHVLSVCLFVEESRGIGFVGLVRPDMVIVPRILGSLILLF